VGTEKQSIFELHRAGSGAATQENRHGTFDEKTSCHRRSSHSLAAPAFAQQASNARRDAQTSHQQWSSRLHVYAPDYYEDWHGNPLVSG
jgi:hypothetical protein